MLHWAHSRSSELNLVSVSLLRVFGAHTSSSVFGAFFGVLGACFPIASSGLLLYVFGVHRGCVFPSSSSGISPGSTVRHLTKHLLLSSQVCLIIIFLKYFLPSTQSFYRLENPPITHIRSSFYPPLYLLNRFVTIYRWREPPGALGGCLWLIGARRTQDDQRQFWRNRGGSIGSWFLLYKCQNNPGRTVPCPTFSHEARHSFSRDRLFPLQPCRSRAVLGD